MKNQFYEKLISENIQPGNQLYIFISYKYWYNCNKILCDKCKKKHSEENKDHQLLGSIVEFNTICIKHKKNLSYFCKDCFINLCDDCFINLCDECLKDHKTENIGHYIEENKKIDDTIIENAQKNIDTMNKSIQKCENLIKENKEMPNKFVLLLKLNFAKLFLLYKSTFLNMYKLNPTNYITINNFLDNNLKIQDIKINKSREIIYNIFTPLYNKSINGFEDLQREKNILNDIIGANNELIDLIKLDKSKYLAFSKLGVLTINDIDFFDLGKYIKLNIDNV